MAILHTVELQIESTNGWERVDIDKNTSFAINFQVSDLTDPTVTKIPYSTQISLPSTNHNNNLFSSLWRIDSAIYRFNPLLRTNFRLYLYNNLYQVGYIKLEEITFDAYKVRLFGGLGDYFYTMSEVSDERDMRLKSLDFGNYFDHTINIDLVWNCWNGRDYSGDAGILNDKLAYIPTYQGQYDNFDSDSIIVGASTVPQQVTWQVGAKQYTNPELNENRRSFVYGDVQYFGDYRTYYQKPMIRFKDIFNKIIETMVNHGWQTELDPTFFNDNNPYWSDLWMLCNNYDTTNDVAATTLTFKPGENLPIPTRVSSSGEYWHFNGENVDNGRAYFNFDYLNGTIQPNTAYALTLDVSFQLRAVWTNEAGAAPGQQIGMKDSGNLTAYLYVGTKAYQLPYDLTLSRDNISYKIPNDFSKPSYEWDDNLAYQPFYYNFYDGGTNGNINTNQSVIDGYTFNIKTIINISDTDITSEPGEIFFGIAFNGSTYWNRFSSNRSYAMAVVVEEDNSSLKISNPEISGTRSGVKITYQDIINSEYTCYDLLSSYCKIFGMYFVKDPVENLVRIMTRNSFFAEKDRIDWTYKIDYSKDPVLKPVPFDYKIGVFKWNSLDTKYEEAYLTETGKDYGSVRFNTGYQFSDDEKNLLDGIIFDNCIIAHDYSNYYFGRNDLLYRDNKILPHLQDNSGSRVDNGFILLFNNGSQETLEGSQFFISDDSNIMRIEGYCWTDNPNNVFVSKKYLQVLRTKKYNNRTHSLEFGSPSKVYNESEYEITSQSGTEASNDTIYGRFWKGYIEDRFDQENKTLTCYVDITSRDIMSNLFNKFIFINNTVWVVNKIYNFDPTNSNTTKVDLIAVQSIQSYISQRYEGWMNPSLTIEPLNTTIGSSGGSYTIEVKANTSWDISRSNSYISVSTASGGAGTTLVTVTVQSNTTGYQRMGSLTISTTYGLNDIDVNHTVAQLAN